MNDDAGSHQATATDKMLISEYVLYHAKIAPERHAFIFKGGVATYAMLANMIHGAADRILRAGLAAGAIAAINVSNPFRHLVLVLALEQCAITSVSHHSDYEASLAGLRLDAVLHDHVSVPFAHVPTLAVDDGWFTLEETPPPSPPRPFAPGQYARIILSSGTTGIPKAIGLTPAVVARRMLGGLVWGSAGDRLLSVAGMSTVGSAYLLHTLAAGGVVCSAPNPEDVLHLIRLCGVNHVFVMSGQLRFLVERQLRGFEACPTLRRLTVGGSPLSEGMIANARATLCGELMLAYGTTESGGIVYGRAGIVRGVEGAVGHVMPGARVEAVDDDGSVLPPGQPGRLRIWSDKCGEYVADRAEERTIFDRDGWFYPGDLGSVDADGLVSVFGKGVDVINRGGSIVSPTLIEETLIRSGRVSDAGVFEMRIAPERVEIWGGIVLAGPFDEAAILRHCIERLDTRAPDRLVAIDAVPRTESGKVIRDRLRQVVLRRHAETAGRNDDRR